jgi:transposase
VKKITTVGIDLAKSVFQLHGVDERGVAVLRKQVRRTDLLRTVAQLPPCTIGLEACASSQFWGRQFERFGHQVRLMSPQFVKPYVKSQKNDQADAEAICEAVQRPNMRFVPLKSLEQQDLQCAHRARQGLMTARTALVNRMRGLLGEYGVVIARRPATVRREVPELLGDASNGVTAAARELIADLYEHFVQLEEHIRRVEDLIDRLGSTQEIITRLRTVPGIGPLTATALFAAVGDGKAFRNGRQMAAWVGLVPRQDSSGGKPRLLGITKRGDKYLRYLLVHGGRCMATLASRKPGAAGCSWINALRERRGKQRAYVAQANKLARIAWAVMTSGENYRPPAAA